MVTNKSAVGIGVKDLHPSRFDSSRPDLLMLSSICHTGIVVTRGDDDDDEEEEEEEEEEDELQEEGSEEGGGEMKSEGE